MTRAMRRGFFIACEVLATACLFAMLFAGLFFGVVVS